MTKPRVSVVMPTAGLNVVDHALVMWGASLTRPAELIVVIDEKGAAMAGEADPGSRIAAHRLPGLRVLRNSGEPTWGLVNQAYNVGFAAAAGDWVVFTHDDALWTERAFEQLFAGIEFADADPQVAAVAITERFVGFWDKQPPTGPPFFCSGVTTCSTAVRRSFWEEMGRFDQTYGVWFDAQVCGELRTRDRRCLFLPVTPGVLHLSTQTFRRHNWADGWRKAPLWRDAVAAYKRLYGHPFRHDRFFKDRQLGPDELYRLGLAGYGVN